MTAVAIPTRNGAADLERVLRALAAQTVPVEVTVLDSSSTDGTADVARAWGASVHVIPQAAFGHGRSRNRLMELTAGDAVAFLTQDAVPVDARWLERLLDAGAPLAYGPYRAPPSAPASLRREYDEFFPAVPRTFAAVDLGVPPGPGFAAFVSSANLCLRRAAWQAVPFRDVPYAEDQRLGLDLLQAGYRKAYVPGAAVDHAHVYARVDRLRRWFDEFRALNEVYGWRAPIHPRTLAGTVRREVAADRAAGASTADALAWHVARVVGAALGTRAGRLPPPLRRRLSLEGRA